MEKKVGFWLGYPMVHTSLGGSVVNRTRYSWRRTGISFQHSHQVVHNCISLQFQFWSSWVPASCTYIQTYIHIYIHTCMLAYMHTHIYIHTQRKLKLKNLRLFYFWDLKDAFTWALRTEKELQRQACMGLKSYRSCVGYFFPSRLTCYLPLVLPLLFITYDLRISEVFNEIICMEDKK